MHWTKLTVLSILFLASLAPGCSPAGEWPYVVQMGDAKVKVEVAMTAEEREHGLMDRDELGADWGMLFVYDRDQALKFWMKNTRVPLSIAFINSGLVVRDIQDMAPETLDNHEAKAPATYALEVNRGWFAKHGVKVGTKVTFSTELDKYIRKGNGVAK